MSKLYNYFFLVRALAFAYIQHFLAFILRVPLPPKTSVAAIIKEGGKYLVIDINYRTGYALPGGLMDPHESFEKAVAREVYEETGLKVIKSTYITSKEDVQFGISVVVAGFIVETEGEVSDSNEGVTKWVTADEYLDQPAYKNSRDVFIYYLKLYENNCN